MISTKHMIRGYWYCGRRWIRSSTQVT